MGSTSRRGDGLPFFESKSPHFFKIILDDILRLGKLGRGIPRNFMERYGSSIPNSVCLKVPSGESWPVELSKHGNDVLFQNGWQEFLEHYSLDYGHLLVFEHDGGSSFNVLIFDKSATEIRYPTIRSKEPKKAGELREPVEERAEDDAINGLSISHRARKRSSLPFPRGQKKARNDLTSPRKSTSKPLPNFRKIDSASKIPEEFGGVQPSCQKEIAASTSRMTCWKTEVVKRAQLLTCQKKSEALQRAKSFRSEHPNFMMVMTKSYVYRRDGYLAIPAKFCKTYIPKKQCDASLCVSDGRNWSVKYKHHANQSSGRLMSGWKRFVRENNIRVEDICVFELIDVSEFKLRVAIFRVDENTNIDPLLGENIPVYVEGGAPLIYDSTDQFFDLSLGGKKMLGNRKGKMKTCENVEGLLRANGFKSVNPYFLVTLKPSYIDRVGLAIPAKFAREHLTKDHCGVTLRVANGRTWPVHYRRKPNRSRFYYGWKEFVKGNGLKAGDDCVFELLDVNEITFRVSVFKGNGSMPTLSE